MMARLFTLIAAATLVGSGCCCVPACGPCGGPFGPRAGMRCLCLPCLPPPIIWNGGCNECGPSACEPCGNACRECGIFPFLMHSKTCGKGCGEIYFNEWVSDPPDCCDPCDQCHGQFTGAQGPCNLGPFQRVLAAFHGYRYCQRPYAGPWCPPCRNAPCGPSCGPGCGCGAEMSPHGADVYYEGPAVNGSQVIPHIDGKSILDENWDAPKATPEPGKPIHKAEQPTRPQMTRQAPQMSQPMSQRPPQAMTRQQASTTNGRPIGSGVRQANYQR